MLQPGFKADFKAGAFRHFALPAARLHSLTFVKPGLSRGML
jgi:hypothetical protein